MSVYIVYYNEKKIKNKKYIYTPYLYDLVKTKVRKIIARIKMLQYNENNILINTN